MNGNELELLESMKNLTDEEKEWFSAYAEIAKELDAVVEGR